MEGLDKIKLVWYTLNIQHTRGSLVFDRESVREDTMIMEIRGEQGEVLYYSANGLVCRTREEARQALER